MKHRFSALWLLLALAAPAAASHAASITEETLALVSGQAAYEYCKTLAAEPFSGRLTGSPGYEAAARWAAAKFKEWGLAAPEGGYLQAFPSPYSLIDSAEMTLVIAGRERKLQAGKEFLPLLFSDSGHASGGVIFAGWGICAPELGYDDYAGIDARGKFILCFRGTPNREEKRFQHHDEHRVRMQTARAKGALGLVYIYPEIQANPNGDRLEKFLPAMVSDAVADAMFAAKGFTAAELKKDLLAYGVPITLPLDVRIDMAVAARHFPDADGFNIVGYLPGSDPELARECIVLGGHFDGCGRHLGILFPGADDNASGSAVVMEVARALAASRQRPKRSLAFVLFGGEEMGLLGSNHYAARMPAPLQKPVAMFNFDMEGEGDRAFATCSPEPAALQRAIAEADRQVQILSGTREIKEVGVRSSDYAPFFLRGIPCAGFFSNGPHLAYHQEGDTILRINPDILGAISRLALLSVRSLADNPALGAD